MLDHFALYGIKPTFHPGADALRQAYVKIQREWHPDFFVSDNEKYTEALRKTAENNEAYKALQSIASIVDYVLREFDLLQEGEKNLLPPAFLADMLDLNDLIGEAAMGDKVSREKAETTLDELQQENMAALEKVTRELEALETWNTENLAPLKTIYQQLRYLGRLRKNLDGVSEM